MNRFHSLLVAFTLDHWKNVRRNAKRVRLCNSNTLRANIKAKNDFSHDRF